MFGKFAGFRQNFETISCLSWGAYYAYLTLCRQAFCHIFFHFSISTHTINYQTYSIEMSQIEKLLSVKGKPIIHYQGYIYTQERITTTKLYFRCQDRACIGKFTLKSSGLNL